MVATTSAVQAKAPTREVVYCCPRCLSKKLKWLSTADALRGVFLCLKCKEVTCL